jgi:hypothetical protein
MTATAIKTNLTKIAVAITALAATLTVGLATPPASHAIDGTSTSAYFCSSPSTPWLTYGGMARRPRWQPGVCCGAREVALPDPKRSFLRLTALLGDGDAGVLLRARRSSDGRRPP